MILISNSQRDEIVRYLADFCKTKGEGTRAYNARRLARKLIKRLESKRTIDISELPEQLRYRR